MRLVLGRHSDIAYALLRIVAGLLFASHGALKLLGWFGGFQGKPGATAALASLHGVAGLIEVVGGLGVALGLFARPLAFLCSGQMAAAYFMVHSPRGFWPIMNGGELAVLYAFLFLFMAARGSGALSLDAALRGDRSRAAQ